MPINFTSATELAYHHFALHKHMQINLDRREGSCRRSILFTNVSAAGGNVEYGDGVTQCMGICPFFLVDGCMRYELNMQAKTTTTSRTK